MHWRVVLCTSAEWTACSTCACFCAASHVSRRLLERKCLGTQQHQIAHRHWTLCLPQCCFMPIGGVCPIVHRNSVGGLRHRVIATVPQSYIASFSGQHQFSDCLRVRAPEHWTWIWTTDSLLHWTLCMLPRLRSPVLCTG